jgi:membrane fusion protein, multidrug efflux system
MNSRLPLVAHRACVCLGMAAALAACDRPEAAPPVRPVLTTTVAIQTSEAFGPFAGTIEPRYQTNLGFQIAGRMVGRDFTVGDLVKNGIRLAVLDTTVLQFQLSAAQADVASAEAQLINVTATEARQRTLLQTGATTQASLESAVASRETADARAVQARANLKKAQDQLGYSEIKADFDGVVTFWSVEVGQVVAAGQTVVTMARPDIREAVFDVPDAMVADIPRDAEFRILLQVDETVTTAGRVREIAPQSDAATRTRRIRLSLDKLPPAFRLGTTVTVSFPRSVAPRIKLPVTALLEQDGKTSVWVVDTGTRTVKRTDVKVISRNAGITIEPTLNAGSQVVIAGVHSLSDGQPVKIEQTP